MELERLLAVLKRRWWLLLAASLLGALTGLAAESARVDVFTATATIQLAPDRNVYGSETVLNRLAVNEIAFIGTSSLRESLIDGLGEAGESIDPATDLTIQQVPDTDLLNISVAASNEQTAITAANTWAQTYVELDRAQERVPLQERLTSATNELREARELRLELDAQLASFVVVRDFDVSTYNEALLRDGELWDAIVKLDQDISALAAERRTAEVELANVLDSSVAAAALGPIEPTRTGNGLGSAQGLIIGFFAAIGFVVMLGNESASHRIVSDIAPTPVWPTSLRLARSRFLMPARRRKLSRNLAAVSTQILNRLPDTRLQVVSFAGVDQSRTQRLKDALADDMGLRGYSVSIMGDDDEVAESRTVDDLLDLLNAKNSVVFADLDELQSKRFTGRIVTVVAVDEHRDRQELVARQIADSLEVSDSVLTVVAQ